MRRAERRWAIWWAIYFGMSVLTFGYATSRIDCEDWRGKYFSERSCQTDYAASSALGAIFWPYYISSEIFNRV